MFFKGDLKVRFDGKGLNLLLTLLYRADLLMSKSANLSVNLNLKICKRTSS